MLSPPLTGPAHTDAPLLPAATQQTCCACPQHWSCPPHCRIRYKLLGPDAELNSPLTEAERASLDALTLDQLMLQFRQQGRTFSKGSSAYRGVSWRKDGEKWKAQIMPPGHNKILYLGLYDTEEEAARAYDAVAVKHHGRQVLVLAWAHACRGVWDVRGG